MWTKKGISNWSREKKKRWDRKAGRESRLGKKVRKQSQSRVFSFPLLLEGIPLFVPVVPTLIQCLETIASYMLSGCLVVLGGRRVGYLLRSNRLPPKLNDLKQRHLVSHSFKSPGVTSPGTLTQSLSQGHTQAQPELQPRQGFLDKDLLLGPLMWLLVGFSPTRAVGLRASALCWLLAGG